jgi:dienelactone hydrolase
MILRITLLVLLGLLIPTHGAAATLSLSVTPKTSLSDAALTVVVENAAPGSQVRVELTTTLFGNAFASHAFYRARADGTVGLNQDAPLSGSYGGVDAMGLFWSVEAAGAFNDVPFDALAPQRVTFTATSGAATVSETIMRLPIALDVSRVEVRSDGLCGTAFLPAGSHRLPGLVVLGGSEGGIPIEMAALLASHGFATFALGYFNVGPLPKALANVPLEYVDRSVAWLKDHGNADPSRIGIIGGSKGAELALLSASKFANIRAAVAMKPSSVVFGGLFFDGPVTPSSWSYGGAPLPYVNGAVPAAVKAQIAADSAANRPVAYSPQYLANIRNATNADVATIAVERINGPIMLVSGDDDQLWPSSYMAGVILQRLRTAKHPYADQWLHYVQAGHGIGSAFQPAMRSTGNQYLALGGTPAANAAASADAWPRIVSFLQKALE